MSKVHLHEIQSLRSSVSKKVQLLRNNLFQFFTPPLLPSPPPTNVSRQDFFSSGHQQQRQDSSSRIEVLPSTEEGAGAGRASQPVPASPDSSTSNLDPHSPHSLLLGPPLPPTAPPPPTPTTTSTPPLSTLDQQGGQLVINSFKTILLSLVSDSTMHSKI